MNTELKKAVKATDKDAQYDTSAKRLLGQKSILAQMCIRDRINSIQRMNCVIAGAINLFQVFCL